jgi:protocatechuate 3,4-dioxygenase beta subunit
MRERRSRRFWLGLALAIGALIALMALLSSPGDERRGDGSQAPHRRSAARGGRRAPPSVQPSPPSVVQVEQGALQRLRAAIVGRVEVTGRVEDERGNPVENAIIRAVRDPGVAALDLASSVETRSDARGEFLLRLPAGTERVAIRATTENPPPRAASVRGLGPPHWGKLDAETIVLAAPLAIRGRVVDEGGQPVEGARVARPSWCMPPSSDRTAPVAWTREDGTFELPCPEGEAAESLAVSHESFATEFVSMAWCGGEPLTVVMRRGTLLRGWVLGEGGRPLVGAPVSVRARGGGRADTRDDGSFELRIAHDGAAQVTASLDGYYSKSQRIDVRPREDVVLELTLELAGWITIRGVVVEAESGRAIEGAVVTDADSPTDRDGRFAARWPLYRAGMPDPEVISAEGRTWLREQPASLSAHKHGYVSGHVSIAAERDVEDVRIELRREEHDSETAVFRGLVVDPDGRPVHGASIDVHREESGSSPARGQRSLTDAEGLFECDGIRAGRYTVAIWHTAFPRLVVSGVELDEGQTREATLVLGWGRGVHGCVLERDSGRPVAFANVEVWRFEDKWFRDCGCWTDGQGRFRLRGFADGPTILAVRASGFSPMILPVDPPAVKGSTLGIDVSLEAGLVLEGVVQGPQGDPVANASVRARQDLAEPAGEILRSAFTARSGADGRFRLLGLPADAVEIEALAFIEGQRGLATSGPFTMAPPFAPITLRLRPSSER